MIIFLYALLMCSMGFLIKSMTDEMLEPVNKEKESRYKLEIMTMEKKRKQLDKQERKDKIYAIFEKHIKLGEYTKTRYQTMIDRLNLKTTPQRIRCTQIAYTLFGAVICIVAGTLNPLISVIGVVGVAVMFFVPVKELEEKISSIDKKFMKDFRGLYLSIFYAFSKSSQVYLDALIKDYIPNVCLETELELNRVIDDIQLKGELTALQALKTRINNPLVSRFCNILESRISGENNVNQLERLKIDINEDYMNSKKAAREKNNKKADSRVTIIYGIIILYVLIYYFFQFIDTMKLFFS